MSSKPPRPSWRPLGQQLEGLMVFVAHAATSRLEAPGRQQLGSPEERRAAGMSAIVDALKREVAAPRGTFLTCHPEAHSSSRLEMAKTTLASLLFQYEHRLGTGEWLLRGHSRPEPSQSVLIDPSDCYGIRFGAPDIASVTLHDGSILYECQIAEAPESSVKASKGSAVANDNPGDQQPELDDFGRIDLWIAGRQAAGERVSKLAAEQAPELKGIKRDALRTRLDDLGHKLPIGNPGKGS